MVEDKMRKTKTRRGETRKMMNGRMMKKEKKDKKDVEITG